MSKPILLPLAAGLQTELTDQLVQPGATLITENCYSEQTGKTHVRFGADVLSTPSQATIPSGGTLPAPWQLASLGGSLVRFNRAPVPLHVWADHPNAWVAPVNEGGIESFRKGPIKLTPSSVFSGTAQVSDTTVAVSADAIVSVFKVDTGTAGTTGTAVAILDRDTRRPAYIRRTGGGTRGQKVVIVGTRAVVAYESAGFLQVDSYNLTTFALAQQQTMGSLMPDMPIDIRVGGPVSGANNVHILYRAATSGNLTCAVVDATNLATNSTFTPRTTAGAVCVTDLAFGWMQDFGVSGKYSIMIADSTLGLRTLWDLPAPTATFSNATATHVLDASANVAPAPNPPAGLRNIIGTTITNSATGVYRVLYEVTALSFKTMSEIKVAVWTGSASLGVQFRSVGIRSKFWQHADDFYFLAAFDGTDQRTYYVLAVDGTTTLTSTTFSAPLAVAFVRDAAGFTESVSSPSAAAVGDTGEIFVGVTEETRTDLIESSGTATGVEQRLFGVDVIRVQHASAAETELSKPAEFIKTLFVPGGSLASFDGATLGLAGFAYYPDNVFALSQTGGNLEHDATYFYRAVYAFMDHNGRVWRSAPSVPIQGDTTGTDFKFRLTLATLRLVDRGLASGQNGHWIEVYRTQANATDGFFQAFIVANDPTVHSIQVFDNVADTALGEQLYTDGNGVENQLLPPVSCAVEWTGRLVVAEAGAGTIWYSVEADFTNGLIFNEALTLDVGDPSDPITGLAVFNETLFVFKAGKTYLISGQGANALGQGQTYYARIIDGSVGCSNPQSIVVADDGVWFRSSSDRAGIHRTAGGAAEYVGQGVRSFDTLTITSAVVVRSKTEIRFYTLSGTTLIWNWTTKMWGTNTGQTCLSATTGYAGASGVVYANTGLSVMSEATADSDDPYTEGGTPYLGRVSSPWYQAAGIAGWERIRRMQGVGSGGSAHRAVIALYKDMNTASFQTASIVFDGSFRPQWDWELRPAQQKYTALRIEVTIYPYQAPAIVIAPAGSSYDGIDPDFGPLWTFPGAAFDASYVGLPLTVAGDGAKNGTYTITTVVSPTQVGMVLAPSGPTGVFVATSIYVTPALQYTAGPGIVGVSLLPAVKEGMDKLPASRRAT